MRIYIRLFSFIIIPVMCVTLLMFFTYQKQLLINAENELVNELKNKWEIINASGVLELPPHEARARLESISRAAPLRITLISSDGVVIDDSYVAADSVPGIENHSSRPEIQDAFKNGEGMEKRFSTTTGQRMIYYAKELKEGGNVLRIAYPMLYVESLKKKMKEQAYATFLGLFAVLFAVLWFISLRVSRPVVKISRIVEDIESGRPPVFPIFKSRLMDKVAGLIYRTYNALEKQKHILEAEKKKLNGLVNLLEEGIIKLDENGRVELANKRAEKILGCLLRQGDDVLAKVTDRDAIVLAKEILSYETDCTKVYELQNAVYELYVRFMEGSRIIVLTDITDSERYSKYKSELITNISHELKTPLALVMGYAETLMEHPNMKPEDRDKFLGKVYKGTTQLNQIINDVIELHRYESSSAEDIETEEETDPAEYAEELRDYYSDKFAPGMKITAEGEPVRVNRAHLSSLVTNLIENAVAYSGKDYIEVRMLSTADEFCLDVEDGGPVIPAEERDRIFERFYTVSKSRNKNISSTGLGLSIVKHICRLYRGGITLETNSRGGNTFKVRITQPE
ncbi:sensor histidine kinase [Geovibrio ferrireducens]|uniref:sensor histidine kinase n=1 Tax=Geovibrio ferrireducens TaxID=46201 RepID=UPI00224673DE|nr:ATP-binding protein [Geovibrio ferrireducens]